MHASTDLRVVKTKSNIQASFVQLLLEKDFQDITVQNILDKALINRKTFYSHYADKYQLAEQIANDFFAELSGYLALRSQGTSTMDHYLQDAESIYAKLYERKNTILALWSIHTEELNVYEHLQNLLQQEYLSVVKDQTADHDTKQQAFFFSTFVLSTLKYMLESGHTYTAHQIAQEFQMFYQTVNPF